MKTLELTDRELSLLMAAIGTHAQELMKEPPKGCLPTPQMGDLINELWALEGDLREILNRDDGWGFDRGPDANDDQNRQQTAEAQFIQAGIDAREAQKARAVQAFGDSDVRLGSMAAQRRAAQRSLERMMQGTATPFVDDDE
jgi:hypothetical protein